MPFGMDPQVAKYFRKILRSLFAGFMWLFINITVGIYYQLAYSDHYSKFIHVLFFVWLAISLALLIWYNYRIWGK